MLSANDAEELLWSIVLRIDNDLTDYIPHDPAKCLDHETLAMMVVIDKGEKFESLNEDEVYKEAINLVMRRAVDLGLMDVLGGGDISEDGDVALTGKVRDLLLEKPHPNTIRDLMFNGWEILGKARRAMLGQGPKPEIVIERGN